MKLAPILAASALALMMLTLATAKPISPPNKTVPLDVAGVDTLEVHVNRSPNIKIASREAPRAIYQDHEHSNFYAVRTGNRLVLRGELEGYQDLEIYVPAGVRTFIVDGANISTKERLGSIEIRMLADSSWSGDAQRLSLVDLTDHSKHKHEEGDEHDEDEDEECNCSIRDMGVYSGNIGVVRATSARGRLKLANPASVGAVYASLGEEGGVTLDTATRFDNIHLMDAAALPPIEQLPVAKPAH